MDPIRGIMLRITWAKRQSMNHQGVLKGSVGLVIGCHLLTIKDRLYLLLSFSLFLYATFCILPWVITLGNLLRFNRNLYPKATLHLLPIMLYASAVMFFTLYLTLVLCSRLTCRPLSPLPSYGSLPLSSYRPRLYLLVYHCTIPRPRARLTSSHLEPNHVP